MNENIYIFGGLLIFAVIWYLIAKPLSDWLESLIKDKKEKF